MVQTNMRMKHSLTDSMLKDTQHTLHINTHTQETETPDMVVLLFGCRSRLKW